MIVSEEQVTVALQYLADFTIAGKIRYHATMAENKAKETWARLYLSFNHGSVKERECRATAHPEYQEAQAQLAQYLADLEEHRSRARSSEMVIELFRTEAANARAAERVR